MEGQPHYLKAIAIAFCVFILDLVSKLLVFHYVPIGYGAFSYPYGGFPVFQDFLGISFSINHAINKGAAWGAFANFQIYLLVLRCFLIAGMIGYLAFFNRKPNWTIPFSIIIAGALGNVLDYFIYGHVIDMLHFVFWGYDYPIFNVADSAIFIGISWLLISSWFDDGKKTK